MKTGDLVKPTEMFPVEVYGAREFYDWVGVVTRVVNDKIVPSLVEVSWNHGQTLKHYSDDLYLIETPILQ